MILTNPPYIAKGIIPSLEKDVRLFEPINALDGGNDGLDHYKIIFKKSKQYLNPGGWLMAEIGYDQGKSTFDLLRSEGFDQIRIIKDHSQNDRILIGQYNQ